jgi:hypothetical protein
MIRNQRSPVFVSICPAITLQIRLKAGGWIVVWLVGFWHFVVINVIWTHLVEIAAERIIWVSTLHLIFIIFIDTFILRTYCACFWLIILIVVAIEITRDLDSIIGFAVRVRSWKIRFERSVIINFGLLNDRCLWSIFISPAAGACNIFVLNSRRFNSTWLVDDICTFRYVSFGNVRCILSATVPALNVMIVIGAGRWGEVRELTSFGLYSFDLPHCFDSILKFFMLYFPLGFLLLAKGRFHFARLLYFLLINWSFYMCHLYWISFANSLMFSYSIRIEFSPASTTGYQISTNFWLTILSHLLFVLIAWSHRFDWLLRFRILAHRTFVDIWFLDHWICFASLLMWNQRFRIESSSTVFALNQSIFHKSIKRLSVELIDVFFCYFFFVY